MTDDIIFDRKGPLLVATLNRPKALNALNLPMIRALDSALIEAADDPSVSAVVLLGAGDKSFCAGGDVVSLATDAPGVEDLRRDFFREEYILNRRIHLFPKPYIPLVDGISMGGGVGVSVHGSHRVASDKVLFAMPETAIGLFPDVGGSYFLPRLQGALGIYLALTNDRLKIEDVIWAGLYDSYVPSVSIDALVEALATANWQADGGDLGAVAQRVIAEFSKSPGLAPLAEHQALIDRCFSKGSFAEILTALDAEDGEFAAKTAATMRGKSPLMSEVSVRQLKRGAELGFDDCMIMEYRMTQAAMSGTEFFEGVRAMLIDKDKNPQWQPARIEDVTDDKVEAFFAPLGETDLRFD